MNDYTQNSIKALQELYLQHSGTPEFIKGGQTATDVLVCAMTYLENRAFNDGDYGGPLNVALHAAYRFSAPSARQEKLSKVGGNP